MMPRKSATQALSLLFLLAMGVAVVPSFAGSAVVGSVAGSRNATIGGQPLLPHTTVFSGDSLEVRDGAAVIAVDETSRMVFGGQTTASFLRDGKEITVLLTRGSVSVYRPRGAVALRVRAGDVSVVPLNAFKTLGEVAMLGGNVVVTAKEGSLQVEGNGTALEVAKGKTITVPAKAARAPGSVPGAQIGAGAAVGLQAASVAAAGTGAVLSGVAISRAGDAREAATAANTAAVQASSSAEQAIDAAEAASAAADAAADVANTVGCALDKVSPTVTVDGQAVSPYTPPAGMTCS